MTSSRGDLGFRQSLVYPSIRRIEPTGQEKFVYLTFDDGPDPSATPAVLDCLAELNAPATFFLVAEKLAWFPDLVRRICENGHAVGNHSLDHRYRVFFRSGHAMKEWIKEAEQEFRRHGLESVGFRPPAGIRTPPLHRALHALDLPLVMWSERFFDTRRVWSRARADHALQRLTPGAIILLHDRQRPERLGTFLDTLRHFIIQARAMGFEFRSLSSDVCRVSGCNPGSRTLA